MRIAETVTFGGSSLDRAAELRGAPAQMAAALAAPGAVTIVLWRGKPLVCDLPQAAADRMPGIGLVRLPSDHPMLISATEPPVLLGREDGVAILAHDLSAWEPAAEQGGAAALDGFQDRSEQQHPSLPQSHRFRELRAVMTQLSPRDAELAATARAVQGWHKTHRFCAQCGAATDLAQGGWQRNCPGCGAHHFPRTDPVVIMLVTHGNSALLGRSPGWPVGMYSCLAGFVEPGETIEAAVRREVWEEAGVRVGAVRYLASQPWPFPASLMLGCHGRALGTGIALDTNELEDALWVTREEMMGILAGTHRRIAPPRPGAIAEFLLRNWVADRME